jgi:hypothetical protein
MRASTGGDVSPCSSVAKIIIAVAWKLSLTKKGNFEIIDFLQES